MARRIAPEISMFTVAPEAGEVKMANGLRVIADHGFADCPPSDAMIVTGGPGWMAQCESAKTLAFMRSYAPGRVMAGVCTGGMILAASGLLNGNMATTKREIAGAEVPPVNVMRERYPLIDVQDSASLVDCGSVITGGGVTLGIDATLHLLARLLERRCRKRNGPHHGILACMASKPGRPAGHRAVTQSVRTRTKDGLIGDHLKALRAARGITLDHLAAATGLTKSYLSKIQNSHKLPPIATLSRIAQALGTGIGSFFGDILQQGEGASVVRSSERLPVVRGGTAFGYDYVSLAHDRLVKRMEPLSSRFPRRSTDTFSSITAAKSSCLS